MLYDIELIKKTQLCYLIHLTAERLHKIATLNMSFQDLYSEHEAKHQLNKKVTIEILRDNVGLDWNQADYGKSIIAGIVYEGRGRLAFWSKGRHRQQNRRTL